MAFFDELGKTLSMAGQAAVQKTKDVTETTKLNMMISEEEKNIKNLYLQIGELYVSIHGNDYESGFSALMEAVKASQDKIDECRRHIQDIKGQIPCEKCGALLPSEAAFCSSCGAAVVRQAIPSANHLVCSSCGAKYDKDACFCYVCGQPIEVASTETHEAIEDAPAAVTMTCPDCGASVDDEQIFCAECGYKLK